jgi:hypothetical protein
MTNKRLLKEMDFDEKVQWIKSCMFDMSDMQREEFISKLTSHKEKLKEDRR